MIEQGHRRKVVLISPELLGDLFTVGYHGHVECTEGLPQNARLVGHGYDHRRDAHYLAFETRQERLERPCTSMPRRRAWDMYRVSPVINNPL